MLFHNKNVFLKRFFKELLVAKPSKLRMNQKQALLFTAQNLKINYKVILIFSNHCVRLLEQSVCCAAEKNI